MARKLDVLLYRIHLVDSGQTIIGKAGLEIGRRMRGEPPVRPCPKGCPFCFEEVSYEEALPSPP